MNRLFKAFRFCPVALVLLAASTGRSADADPPLQTPRHSTDYARRRDQILPNPSEQSYRTIDWRNSVLSGVVDAQRLDRPIMLVLMNGHPLGCT